MMDGGYSLHCLRRCGARARQRSHAQWKPEKNVEIVVPSAPGGSNDKTARTVERIIQEKRLLAGTTLTVVNKPGGGNMMTMNYLVQHPGDAHYVMIGTPTHTDQPHHRLPARSITPTSRRSPRCSTITSCSRSKRMAQFKTGRDLVDRLKKDPKSVAIGFATAIGSHNHIAAGLLAKTIGADVRSLKVVAFKGSSEAITALLGGHIDLVTTAAGNVAEQVQAGKLRVIGVAANQRLPGALAASPTWKEQGVNIVFGGWRSIMGPKGMTPAQIAYWEKILSQVVATPEWKTDLERNYWSDDFTLSEQFRTDLKQEYADMKAVLVELGLAK